MVHQRIDRCRFLNVQASFCFAALTLLLATGCHTIASLGLPVSSGSNYLLSDAMEIREAVGRKTDFATELAKAR